MLDFGRTLTFKGHSDDILEIDGTYGGETSAVGADRNDVATVDLVAPDGCDGLKVVASYVHPGVWSLGVAPLCEAVPMPDWPIRFRTARNRYSSEMLIDVPEGTRVVVAVIL